MKYLTTIALVAIITLPTLALAQGFTPLVGIGIDPDQDFDGYINALYAISIGIAALLAVIKIIIAGVKWMMTDIAPSKSEAKKDIQGALLGLLIVLGAVLIITVINPDILKVDLTMKKLDATKGVKVYTGSNSVEGSKAPVTPYTLMEGDYAYSLPKPASATEISECQTVVPAKCSTTPGMWCYPGEYYPDNGSGRPVCVVRGKNK